MCRAYLASIVYVGVCTHSMARIAAEAEGTARLFLALPLHSPRIDRDRGNAYYACLWCALDSMRLFIGTINPISNVL